MFDPRSYRDACSELHLSEETMEEILAMTNIDKKKQKLRHPLRMGAVIAATMALLTIGASAAGNPQMLESLTFHITNAFHVGALRQDMTTEDGMELTSLEIPAAEIREEDGRTLLAVMEEEIDITDALEQQGRYEYGYEDEGAHFTVLVEGTPQDWTMTTSTGVPGEEPMLTVVTTKDAMDRAVAPGADPSAQGLQETDLAAQNAKIGVVLPE